MDPIKLLKQDHRTVKALFRKFEKAPRKSEKQKIGAEIVAELSVHSAIEEQLVYPLLRRLDKRAEQSVLNALEEHHIAKLVLAELDKMDVDDERYAAKVHVLTEAIELHIEEEELKLLPKLARLLDAQKAEHLAQAMLLMRKAAPIHPRPAAPDEFPANLIAAMVAKMSDGRALVLRLVNEGKAEVQRRVAKRAPATTQVARASATTQAARAPATTPAARRSRSGRTAPTPAE